MNQNNTEGDFTTLYISNDLDRKIKLKIQDIYISLIEYIKSKGIAVDTEDFKDKRGYMHRKNYIKSIINSKMSWRIAISPDSENNVKRFYLSLSPEFEFKKQYLKTYEVEQIAKDDVNYIEKMIGSSVDISVGNIDMNFQAISYSSEKRIDIGDWNITFDSKEIYYSKLINDASILLKQLGDKKTFKYRIIDTANSSSADIGKVTNLLDKYGEYLGPVFNQNNYTKIAELPHQKDIVNVVLLAKSDKQYYNDTKEFFLTYNIPYQHIKMRDEFFLHDYLNRTCIVELYKKTHPQDLYLLPDHFLNSHLAGFIYLDVDSIHNELQNTYSNYLTISYIFSENRDYSDEKILVGSNIKVYLKRDYMDIIETDKTVDLLMRNEIVKKYSNAGRYFNIVVSKKFNTRSKLLIIERLRENGLNINKIYYVSNFRSRFVDNYNYYNPTNSQHPYKIVGKNTAIIKLATRPYLFAQLFSSFVEVLYPLDNEISVEDLKNIIWLNKKRLYRTYSLRDMTLLEPIVIKRKNKEFITSKMPDLNINFLI